tara:strand:- start:74 stop:1117 length:1044 start_codon:yes stop_codon:yes gene_type:complete
MRDKVLDQHSELLCLFARIEDVMLTECAQYQELRAGRMKSKDKGADADRWAHFASIADVSTGLRVNDCTPPITKASGFWGKDKVLHYMFAREGWKYCKMLGTTASRNPDWKQFRMKQNQLTLANKYCKDSLNPISLSNLKFIQDWHRCGDHSMKRGKDFVILEYQAVSTSDLSAEYAFDKYGLVVLKKFIDAEQLSVESPASWMVTETVQLASEEGSSIEDADNSLPSLSLRLGSDIPASRLIASSSPISTPSLLTTASPTPGQLPELNEGPSNRPTSSENASSTGLSSLPSTKPSSPTQSPAYRFESPPITNEGSISLHAAVFSLVNAKELSCALYLSVHRRLQRD